MPLVRRVRRGKLGGVSGSPTMTTRCLAKMVRRGMALLGARGQTDPQRLLPAERDNGT
jgi:hypothetical protein